MTSSYWALWDVPYWQIMHQAAPLIVAINIFRWICCTKCCWILLFFVQRHFACLDDAYLFPALILQELHLNKLDRSVVVCNAAVSACEKGALGYKSWKWKKLPVLRIFLVFCSNMWWCEAFLAKMDVISSWKWNDLNPWWILLVVALFACQAVSGLMFCTWCLRCFAISLRPVWWEPRFRGSVFKLHLGT